MTFTYTVTYDNPATTTVERPTDCLIVTQYTTQEQLIKRCLH